MAKIKNMVTKTTIAETVVQASSLVKLIDGCANNYGKYGSYYVRPCTAFEV